MMDAAQLTKKLIDIPKVFPMRNISIPTDANKWEEIFKRSELVADKVLFSNDQFTVATLTNGKHVACWEAHAYVGSLDEVKAELNHAEKALLPN